MSGVICFTRGRSLYQIARAGAEGGYVGFRDGRVVARGLERGEVARLLITIQGSAS